MKLSYTPRAAVAEGGTGEAHLNTLASPHEPEAPERRYRRRNAQADSRGETESARRSATATRHAVLGVIGEMESSLGALAGSLPSFTARGQTHDVFSRYAMYGDTQLKWIHRALAGATSLTDVAVQVSEPEMEQGVLRMTGPRLQAAMFGTILLTAWADFLKLTDAVLRRCPFYSVERLFMDMARVKKLIEPSLAALASLEPGQVESAATAMPALMGQLTREFHSIREGARAATERGGQLMAAAQFVEMLTLASALKLSLPRLPPAAPATLGVGLMMGSNGVMMGTRMVVSAEWVERVRQLVQAGVFSAPVVSAAVRIHAGQVMMAQSNQELPRGVRDALGDGPEVRAMHETGRAGAGMAEPPRHHVLPREHREWFEKRGFTGDMNIDQFCVKMEGAHHQAIHGGGDWRKGRMWPGEWNQALMRDLLKAEATLGRMLTRNEVLSLVAKKMKDYKIPMSFTRWEGR
ncbi:DUF2380 domain-containing protein [Pyxidicoccus sp. 3LFB2]